MDRKMGPIALFDKSFLHGLNVDEAVLFDHFFLSVICPIFFVETLADLGKEMKKGRTAEQVVGSIAFRTPEMHGTLNVYHGTLVSQNLLGAKVPMTGQIVPPGPTPVSVNGEHCVRYKPSPEAQAMQRWQDSNFEAAEREYARVWRAQLGRTDLKEVAKRALSYGIDFSKVKSLADAKNAADSVISSLPEAAQLSLAIEKFNLSQTIVPHVWQRWHATGQRPMASFAPYAAFVLSIDIFFEIALATGKISADRASNINDVAYLYYLPFCMLFVSSDRLHRECAPLFMRKNQEFVWGIDLKADLGANDAGLKSSLSNDQRMRGLMALDVAPIDGGLTSELYRRHLSPPKEPASTLDDDASKKLLEKVERISSAPASAAAPRIDEENISSMVLERMISRRRGSWLQAPDSTD